MIPIASPHRPHAAPRSDARPSASRSVLLAPSRRPVAKYRNSVRALPLASLPALLPGPSPKRHGLWQRPRAWLDGVQAACAYAWHFLVSRVLRLIVGLGWKRVKPAAHAAPAAADSRASSSMQAATARGAAGSVHAARTSPRQTSPRKVDDVEVAAASASSPTVLRWRDVLDLFHIKLVHMRLPKEDEPSNQWIEEGRSAHFVFRSGGFVRYFVDTDGEPGLLFDSRKFDKDGARLRRLAPHLDFSHAKGNGSEEANRTQPISAASFAAHMRVVAAVAALPAWPVARQPIEHPLPQKAQRHILENDIQPAPVARADLIKDRLTRLRDWTENDRLLVAVADSSNLFGAQAIMDVVVRDGSVHDLRLNRALLKRYGIADDQASRIKDEVLVQRMLSTLVLSMRKKWRVQLLKRQQSYREPQAELSRIKGAASVSLYR